MKADAKTKLMPTAGRLIVRCTSADALTPLPTLRQEQAQEGEVLAVAPDSTDNGLRIGQVVLFDRHVGSEAVIDGKPVLVLKTGDVLAVIERQSRRQQRRRCRAAERRGEGVEYNRFSKPEALHCGWQDGKFVLLVMDADGEIKHRISCTRDEWNLITVHAEKDALTALVLKDHRQIDTGDPLPVKASRRLPMAYKRFKNYKPTAERRLDPIDKESKYGPGFSVSTFMGAPAFTNGHIMVAMPLPVEYVQSPKSPSFSIFEDVEFHKLAQPLKPVCVQVCDHGDDKTVTVIWFDREYPVSALYWDWIVERWPDAEFRAVVRDHRLRKVELEKPYLIFADSAAVKPIGAVMPMRFEADETVEQLRVEATVAANKSKVAP